MYSAHAGVILGTKRLRGVKWAASGKWVESELLKNANHCQFGNWIADLHDDRLMGQSSDEDVSGFTPSLLIPATAFTPSDLCLHFCEWEMLQPVHNES
jgi:hypothetical protein